jgi:hypothetical protein
MSKVSKRSFQPQLVLGDAEAYAAARAAEQRAEEDARAARDALISSSNGGPASPQGSRGAAFDPSTIPKQIWDAANLLSDKGTAIIQIYQELAAGRWVCLLGVLVQWQRSATAGSYQHTPASQQQLQLVLYLYGWHVQQSDALSSNICRALVSSGGTTIHCHDLYNHGSCRRSTHMHVVYC